MAERTQPKPTDQDPLLSRRLTRRGVLLAGALGALSACGFEAPSSPNTPTPTPPADRKKQPPAQGDHDDSTDQMTPEKIVERAKAGAELVHKTIESSLTLAADVLGEDTYDSGNEDGYRRIFNKEYSVDDDGEPRPASPTPFVDVTYIPDTEGEGGGLLKVWLAKDIGVPSDAVADEIALEFQLGSDNLITQYDTMTPDILRQIVTELVPGDGTITLTQMKGSASAGYITAGLENPNTQNQTGVLFDVVSKDNVYKMAVADGDIPESIGYPYTPEDPTYAAAVKDVEAATEHVHKMLT